ncbi:MAG: hypothetical protein ABIP04_07550 [Sulfuriferula sp.]
MSGIAAAATGQDAQGVAIASSAKGELLLTLGDRHWRICGWKKNLSPEQMRVNNCILVPSNCAIHHKPYMIRL